MSHPENGLSVPVVQDWPGKGTASVGYGSAGGLVWDDAGEPVLARQNTAPRLVNNGTRKIADPVQPMNSFKSQASSDIANISRFLGAIGAAGIPEDLLIAETYDTANTTSPSTIDPQVGQRIYEVDAGSGLFAFADDNFVFLVDGDDSIVRTVDMCSPVLQIDKFGLVRTRRGLATIDAAGNVEYLRDDAFMHASSKGKQGDEVLATSVGGTIMLFDVETKARKWKQTMSRGSMNRWSRVIGLENPATILWCNRFEMALVDLREKPRRRQKALSILDYTDRLTEIREVDAGVERGNDVFALTSREVLWLSATPSRPMHPVLSQRHMFSNEDKSLNFYRGAFAGNDLPTICSQLTPITAVGCFGRTQKDDLPASLRDLYFVDAWPSIIPQSHMTRETSLGVDLYSVGRDGGLFKQSWAKPDVVGHEGILDLPPPDPLPEPNHAAVVGASRQPDHRDYDLLDARDGHGHYHFQWLYQWAFKPLGELQEKLYGLDDISLNSKQQALSGGVADPDAQFWASDNLRDHIERAWLDPLEEKAAASDVHPETLNVRRHVIDLMVHDALTASEREPNADEIEASLKEAVPEIQMLSTFTEMLEEWQLPEDQHTSDAADTWELASQPTQMAHSSQSSQTQPMPAASSFSQPVPGLPSLKVSKKRRGDKKPNKEKRPRR